MANKRERYIASMVLHGVGDAMGYYGGQWEFCKIGKLIHDECSAFGGINNLKLEPKKWPVSDDTVLHLANAECLVQNKNLSPGVAIYKELIKHYKKGMRDMAGRAPGPTTINSVQSLSTASDYGYRIPFNPRGGGCGASMRSSCIGLRYSKPEELNYLIAYSVESGRMTHHLPLGYLGSLVAALFTSYAIQDKPVENWGVDLLSTLPRAKEHIRKENYCVDENLNNWAAVIDEWMRYLKLRNIDKPNMKPNFPENYDVEERDRFYKFLSYGHWPGANGTDSVLIAYDALLGSGKNWEELCLRGMLHCGDSDSTGCIAGSWYGALYGFENVHKNNYEKLEYFERLTECGEQLYNISHNE